MNVPHTAHHTASVALRLAARALRCNPAATDPCAWDESHPVGSSACSQSAPARGSEPHRPREQTAHQLRAYSTAAAARALSRGAGPAPPTRGTSCHARPRATDGRHTSAARTLQTAGGGPPPTGWSCCASHAATRASLPHRGAVRRGTWERCPRRAVWTHAHPTARDGDGAKSRARTRWSRADARHSRDGAGTHVEGVELSEHGAR